MNAQLGEIYMLHDRFVNGRASERAREGGMERVIVLSRTHLWEWGELSSGVRTTQLRNIMREITFHEPTFCENLASKMA